MKTLEEGLVKIRNKKDFWSGVLFVGFGALFVGLGIRTAPAGSI